MCADKQPMLRWKGQNKNTTRTRFSYFHYNSFIVVCLSRSVRCEKIRGKIRIEKNCIYATLLVDRKWIDTNETVDINEVLDFGLSILDIIQKSVKVLCGGVLLCLTLVKILSNQTTHFLMVE